MSLQPRLCLMLSTNPDNAPDIAPEPKLNTVVTIQLVYGKDTIKPIRGIEEVHSTTGATKWTDDVVRIAAGMVEKATELRGGKMIRIPAQIERICVKAPNTDNQLEVKKHVENAPRKVIWNDYQLEKMLWNEERSETPLDHPRIEIMIEYDAVLEWLHSQNY